MQVKEGETFFNGFLKLMFTFNMLLLFQDFNNITFTLFWKYVMKFTEKNPTK